MYFSIVVEQRLNLERYSYDTKFTRDTVQSRATIFFHFTIAVVRRRKHQPACRHILTYYNIFV